MLSLHTPADLLEAIATFVRKTRLSRNVPAEELASRAAIGIATLHRIEKTGRCSTESLSRVVGALGKIDDVMAVFTAEEQPQSIAELRALAKLQKVRQRASGKPQK